VRATGGEYRRGGPAVTTVVAAPYDQIDPEAGAPPRELQHRPGEMASGTQHQRIERLTGPDRSSIRRTSLAG
jgi:hypothetical protein